MARILVVDDESLVRILVADTAGGMGHEVLAAASLTEAEEKAAKGIDVVFLDVLLPDGNGLENVARFTRLPGTPEVIVITGHGSADGAETALRHGVWDYVQKPLKVQEVMLSLSRALAYRAGRNSATGRRPLRRDAIVGDSPALREALDLVEEAAASTVNVLITGETGTGKELFARAVHANSARCESPLVTLDCASLTENLVESQLFGHVRGAFTGAERNSEGLLRQAHGGTLFLDEAGDLPLAMQGSFLRALELRRFRPVGSAHEVSSDFRLVAATNKNLHEMTRLDLFRSDLLYRLRGLTITLPPLRDRTADILPLCEHVIEGYCAQHGAPMKQMAGDFMETVERYAWPGNIRELRHAVERACTAAHDDSTLYARQLPVEVRVTVARATIPCASEVDHCMPAAEGHDGTPMTLRDYKACAERAYVTRLLDRHGADVRAAASEAGISRGHLYELVRKHGLARDGN
ncbi:sigma-54-dependent transcriptional regulator [Nitratidesulfovibrio vulgaris]|uniref:Sigma-54 dependent DNA-binding response regulator n=1 Tax=Nitratidesulfovibrio vulgaris (strain ATCC 29579 / DSM 644 / CCUG 34227 / NCIMB 8303 / VKM B-1760 / Hildenborough) TaxID=882 RepID=Q72EF7_NITV2|nr:sigma-54 dependent transcriptional regulator [Nitratidesulfovibrio vulgaris]AAS95102.1 sigma-54 dependent DNA-binding response regulator [Nitratidesulfovibrio vulgaris str. Hildenborough]ADP85736.1 putative two component, sigma54 specific, transcriptional regulator, Fis family [Nitratidesulfovibrio vulgaris RCH1]